MNVEDHPRKLKSHLLRYLIVKRQLSFVTTNNHTLPNVYCVVVHFGVNIDHDLLPAKVAAMVELPFPQRYRPRCIDRFSALHGRPILASTLTMIPSSLRWLPWWSHLFYNGVGLHALID
jgi:hypothetical protein